MACEFTDRNKITVTMSMEQYEHYQGAELYRDNVIRMFKRANKDGVAVMTDELKETIEEIYS